MDAGPEGEAPHHRMSSDYEHALGATARTSCSGKRWVSKERADQQDRGEPHQERPHDPAGASGIPHRWLATAPVVEINHQPERDQRDERIDSLEELFTRGTNKRSAERVR